MQSRYLTWSEGGRGCLSPRDGLERKEIIGVFWGGGEGSGVGTAC